MYEVFMLSLYPFFIISKESSMVNVLIYQQKKSMVNVLKLSLTVCLALQIYNP